MAKLFVFGIGGTGARVMKSLIMLVAAGVEMDYEIVPILIDPDRAGGDLNRTVKLMRDYQAIHRELTDFSHNRFFKASVTELTEVITRNGGTAVMDGFRFELNGVQNDTFSDFIDYVNLDESNKWLASLLFSSENLNSDLEVGFKGNPNIGSVVLNQFTRSDTFEAFASNFDDKDKIMIISSIFGGTGAAGFPLLLKNMREGVVKGNNYEFLKNAVIGAISVQPYFKVSANENSKIDSNSFISKTKAALHYYHKSVTGNNSVNALYYIGDTDSNEYTNNEGGGEQRNDAHFVELASALAIIDFCKISSELKTTNARAENPLYKEFGIKQNSQRITLNDLADETRRLLDQPLTKYFYFNIFLTERLRSQLNNPFANGYPNKIDQNFIDQQFYRTLSEFNKSFRAWLAELYRNKVSFAPFNIKPIIGSNNGVSDFSIDTTSIFSLVNNVAEKRSVNPFAQNNYELFIDKLNDAALKIGNTTTSKRFMGVFSKGCDGIVQSKLF